MVIDENANKKYTNEVLNFTKQVVKCDITLESRIWPTTWVFPLGAYHLAYLQVHGSTPEAAERVRQQLQPPEAMLRQGCLGQLPEIYDGDHPTEGKGCFAQAWSVGEMLRVFEAIEKI